MIKIIQSGARIVLGLIYFIFGGMGLLMALGIMPAAMPPMSGPVDTFFKGIMAAGYFFPLLKFTETFCGLLLLLNLGAPLALIILAPITLNIFLFHFCLTPGAGNLLLPATMVVMQFIAMRGYLIKYYRPLFTQGA